jgi:DUF1680 family protein
MNDCRMLLLMSLLVAQVMPKAAGGQPPPRRDYPIQPVLFTNVHIADDFWSRRLEINRKITIPYAFKQCEATGRIDNFAIAGGLKKGKFCGIHFNDSDVYKVIEGASYALAISRDPELERYVDSVITKIAAAQEKDGYLYTARTLMGPDYTPPGGKERWSEAAGSHELYNVGHLYEAAVAHFQATGKRTLLDVALRNAELITSTFGPGKRREVPGHQEIEIGLCKLYRLTGDEKYLRTAKFFLDERGNAQGHELMGEYAQDHKPVIQQDKAVGHAVRACYMFSGMADVAALSGDASYVAAIDRLWNDVLTTKMYVTGGIGATGGNEGFAEDYALPNLSAYCETCASIAFALWNHRMFLLHGDARYMDVVERVMYNGFLSGVSMTGDRFFYPNPLETFRGSDRSPWFDCACCPSNIVRFVPSIPGYMYARKKDTLYVNLFIGGTASVDLDGRSVTITQTTRYPWDGSVRILLDPEQAGEFALAVRIPGWAVNRPVPGDLYRYLGESTAGVRIAVNGQPFEAPQEKSFAVIRRAWKKSDAVDVNFSMQVRRVLAHPKIQDDKGRVALERGPLVFCLEWPDNKDGHVLNMVLPDDSPLREEFRSDLLNGVEVIRGRGTPVRRTLDGSVVPGEQQELVAIPYYAWAHRGKGEMTVWAAREAASARPLPAPTIAFMSKVTASGDVRADAVNDQFEPTSSIDHTIPFMHWWPRKGTQEWVQYDFQKPEKVSAVEVYWFDDTGLGECRIPKSWRVLYKEGEEWKPVQTQGPYGIEKDRYNRVTFAPVATGALKLEIQLVPDYSAGLFEWKVE